ncbi:hypothetical protein Bca52824_088345 [Brassica carinata]|uniref:Uncharacterized protein n=1 Tax=Brassica carinata TaxID=52824 RepID=A0A8X7TNQ8_BRACI|nr:hypothetical protein Bca52824_088345 [Brassica carinata]
MEDRDPITRSTPPALRLVGDVAVVVGVVLTRSFDVDRTSIFVTNLDWRQAQIVTNRNGSAPEVKDETADAEAEARVTEAEAEA